MIKKPPRRTRQRILDVSLRKFNVIGEPNVTTSSIAEALGISPGNLYYHFRNKDDIVNALFEQFEHGLEPFLSTPPNERDTVEAGDSFLREMFAHKWRYRFIYRDLNELLSRNRHIELRFKKITERKLNMVRTLCEHLQATGKMTLSAQEVTALATNVVIVYTYWGSFEYIQNARRFRDPEFKRTLQANGIRQIQALMLPYLSQKYRDQFHKKDVPPKASDDASPIAPNDQTTNA